MLVAPVAIAALHTHPHTHTHLQMGSVSYIRKLLFEQKRANVSFITVCAYRAIHHHTNYQRIKIALIPDEPLCGKQNVL